MIVVLMVMCPLVRTAPPEYSGAAGAKSARLSDGTDDYSSKTSESWDE